MSGKVEDGSHFEMLVSLYDFTASLSQTLSFEKDEKFIFHSSNNITKNWWSVVNSKGKQGYIPSNYVNVTKVSREEYLLFVNLLIEKVGKEIARDGGGPSSDKKLELMQELLARKQQVEKIKHKSYQTEYKKEHAPPPPTRMSQSESHCSLRSHNDTSYKSLPSMSKSVESESSLARSNSFKDDRVLPCRSNSENRSNSAKECRSNSGKELIRNNSGKDLSRGKELTRSNSGRELTRSNSGRELIRSNSGSFKEDRVLPVTNQDRDPPQRVDSAISDDAAYSLIQRVRESTGLSFEMSKLAVGCVCEGLSHCNGLSILMNSILDQLQRKLIQSPHRLETTQDAIELNQALIHIATCHDDAQQRSWQLWDDEHTITSTLQLIINVLDNADPEISKLVLKQDNYDRVSVLLEYYQMEDRWSIRELLLMTFTSMSSLDTTVISVLLNSVLPMELAREMEANIKNIKRISKLAKLLTVIFSTGEPMPITHLEHLGSEFVHMVVDIIEGDDSETSDIMLSLLLSYNLQFKPNSHTNITVQTLNQVDSVKIFTEKLLLLINREEDPVQSSLKSPSCAYHSVIKLFKDIFTGESASILFYTNDIRVLVDIITRQLTDLPPHNEKRTEYLHLCKLVLIQCDEICYEHHISELSSILTHIMTEEVPPSETDRAIVRDIISNLPDIFGFGQQQVTG